MDCWPQVSLLYPRRRAHRLAKGAQARTAGRRGRSPWGGQAPTSRQLAQEGLPAWPRPRRPAAGLSRIREIQGQLLGGMAAVWSEGRCSAGSVSAVRPCSLRGAHPPTGLQATCCQDTQLDQSCVVVRGRAAPGLHGPPRLLAGRTSRSWAGAVHCLGRVLTAHVQAVLKERAGGRWGGDRLQPLLSHLQWS